MLIDIKVKKLRVKVDRPAARQEARNAVRRRVVDVTRKVQNQAVVNCPVDTGNMRAQHSMTVTETATKVRGTVTNNAKYAAAVHNGTRAHTITARRGTALRFKAGGTVIYARSVRHPGTTARPWLARAAQQVANEEGYRWAAE